MTTLIPCRVRSRPSCAIPASRHLSTQVACRCRNRRRSDASSTSPPVRRRKKERDLLYQNEELGVDGFRGLDRLGLVLLPDQADLHGRCTVQRHYRQYGLAIIVLTLFIKALLFPLAYKSYVSMSKMKDASARDGEAQGKGRRRPPEAAAGDDGALQEGKGEPRCGLSADPDADPDLLFAVQGAVRHDRNAPRAVLRLDSRSQRAGPDLDDEPVRPVAVSTPDPGRASSSCLSACGRS